MEFVVHLLMFIVTAWLVSGVVANLWNGIADYRLDKQLRKQGFVRGGGV